MTKSTITRERIELIANFHRAMTLPPSHDEIEELARIALAAMDSEPVEMPLDYLQGHKDGLEWAAQLAEANHPETGDWLYDDPIELAKAIRKGPDMPPSQPAPVAHVCTCPSGDGSLRWPCQVHPGSSPVIPDGYVMVPKEMTDEIGEAIAMQANCCGGIALDIYDAMLAAAPHDTPALNSLQGVDSVTGGWIPVSEGMPENDGAYLCWDNRYVTTYAFIFGAWQANQFVAKNITHWMPLPAGPKEVQGE